MDHWDFYTRNKNVVERSDGGTAQLRLPFAVYIEAPFPKRELGHCAEQLLRHYHPLFFRDANAALGFAYEHHETQAPMVTVAAQRRVNGWEGFTLYAFCGERLAHEEALLTPTMHEIMDVEFSRLENHLSRP